MYRVAVPVMFVAAVILGIVGGAPTHSRAQSGSPTPSVTPTPDGLCEFGSQANWQFADVRPAGVNDAAVIPAAELETSEPEPARQLYLVVITLPPGHCMPYTTLGNQKDGAIVMIVQQGVVEFRWEPNPNVPGSPVVERGDSAGLEGAMPAVTTQPFHPGDWITFDQEVKFSYRNVGGDSAIILKAVWADPGDGGGGCGGGCR